MSRRSPRTRPTLPHRRRVLGRPRSPRVTRFRQAQRPALTDGPEVQQEAHRRLLTVINNGSDAVTIKTIGFRAAIQQQSRSYLDFLETWGRPHSRPLVVTRPSCRSASRATIVESTNTARTPSRHCLPVSTGAMPSGTSRFESGRSATDGRSASPGRRKQF